MKPIQLFLCLLVLVQSALAAANNLMDSTGFEPPGSTSVLPSQGQDNQEMDPDRQPTPVATPEARAGLQGLRVNGALLGKSTVNSASDVRLASGASVPVTALIGLGPGTWPYTNTFVVDEFEPVAKVLVIRRGFTGTAMRARVVTADGTARAGEHYVATSTFVTFEVGETNKILEIPLAPDDAWAEKDVTFTVHITELPPGTASPRPMAKVTVRDDERPGGLDHAWNSTLGLPPLGSTDAKWAYPSIVAVQPDGKLLVDVGVYAADTITILFWRLVRINPDGSVDETYPVRDSLPQKRENHLVNRKVVRLADGGLLVWDSETFRGSGVRYRLKPDGTVDESFPKLTSVVLELFECIPQPDGKILVVTRFAVLLNGKQMPWLFRLNSDGTLDAGFRAPSSLNSIRPGVHLLDDGKIIVRKSRSGGSPGTIHRLRKDGTLDSSFAAPEDLDLRHVVYHWPDGRLLVDVYSGNSVRIHRLNQNGSVDSSFSAGNVDSSGSPLGVWIETTIPQPDGKLILAGRFGAYNGQNRGSLVRLNADGSVDPTYQSGQGVTGYSQYPSGAGDLWRAELLSDGRLLLAGDFDRFNGEPVTPPIILNPDGTREPTFEGTMPDIDGVGSLRLTYPIAQAGGHIHVETGYGLGRVRKELPLQIVAHDHKTNGVSRLTANALTGRGYTLQTSDNLADWTELLTQVAATNRIDFLDAAGATSAKRFYRVIQK